MNDFEKIFNRVNQFALAKGQTLMHYGMPEEIKGPGAICKLPEKIKEDGVKKVLVVAGKTVAKHGLLGDFLTTMKQTGVEYAIFDGAEPNPTIDNIEEGLRVYRNENCQGFVAIGGGSSMDCAKIIAARAANPNKSVEKMGGNLKVTHKIAPFYAVPTTAGTGSETTIAAVVVNSKTKHKYSVNDPKLLPKVAVLDPKLTVSLPPSVTEATGMDALTHAVEAYTNKFGNPLAYRYAKHAVKLIFENLPKAYADGNDLEARENMLLASYYAGVAFTRNCVGYVHAAGHPLSGFYNLPHGQVMASILPIVMRSYGYRVYEPLAKLGSLVGIKGNSQKSIAIKFIKAIEKMNAEFKIPTHYDEIKKEDIDKMSSYAIVEANRVYPTPMMWDKINFKAIYYTLANEI